MDPALREIWSAVQNQTANRRPDRQPVETLQDTLDPSPEALRDQAYLLSSAGERREAADMLRRAVNLADSLDVDPPRMIPLLEAMAEVLWQLGEKLEARMCANRALRLWFATRPDVAFDLAGERASGIVS